MGAYPIGNAVKPTDDPIPIIDQRIANNPPNISPKPVSLKITPKQRIWNIKNHVDDAVGLVAVGRQARDHETYHQAYQRRERKRDVNFQWRRQQDRLRERRDDIDDDCQTNACAAPVTRATLPAKLAIETSPCWVLTRDIHSNTTSENPKSIHYPCGGVSYGLAR